MAEIWHFSLGIGGMRTHCRIAAVACVSTGTVARALDKQRMLVQPLNQDPPPRKRRANEPVALVVVVHMNAGVDGSSNATAVQHLVDEIKDRFVAVETDQRWLLLGDLVLDREARAVTRGSQHIHLAPLEYALLEYLALHPERVFSEDHLMDAIFGGARDGRRYNTLWVHMHRLRKKVDGDAPVKLIHTIRGAGYMLRVPINHAIETSAPSSSIAAS